MRRSRTFLLIGLAVFIAGSVACKKASDSGDDDGSSGGGGTVLLQEFTPGDVESFTAATDNAWDLANNEDLGTWLMGGTLGDLPVAVLEKGKDCPILLGSSTTVSVICNETNWEVVGDINPSYFVEKDLPYGIGAGSYSDVVSTIEVTDTSGSAPEKVTITKMTSGGDRTFFLFATPTPQDAINVRATDEAGELIHDQELCKDPLAVHPCKSSNDEKDSEG